MLKTAATLLLLLVVPSAAFAEWHFTPMVGFTFKGVTNLLDVEQATEKKHGNLGGSVMLLGGGILGVEGIGVWTPSFFQNDESVLQGVETGRATAYMGNVVLTLPRHLTEYGLRPYFSGGVGALQAVVTQKVSGPQGPPLDLVRFNALAYNLGGGAIGFFTDRTGVRFDFRYYSTFRRSADPLTSDPESYYLRYMTLSVGVVLRRR